MLKNIKKNVDRTKISDWDPKTYWEFKKTLMTSFAGEVTPAPTPSQRS
jgi:hypothetical protein